MCDRISDFNAHTLSPVSFQNTMLIENDYKLLKKKYTDLIVNKMIYHSDISFSEITEEEVNNLTFEMLQWSNYSEEYRPKFSFDDTIQIVNLTRIYSPYLPVAIENYWVKCRHRDYKNFITDIFFYECYIDAIIEYAYKFTEYFNTDKLLKETLKYFSIEENRNNYFCFG